VPNGGQACFDAVSLSYVSEPAGYMQAAVSFTENFDSLWLLAQICKMLTAGKVDFKEDYAVLTDVWLEKRLWLE